MTFTQLQVHSNYTLLHSPLALPDLIQAQKIGVIRPWH